MKIDVNNNYALMEHSKKNAKGEQPKLTPNEIEDKLRMNKLPSKLLDTVIDKHFKEHSGEEKDYKFETYGEKEELVFTVTNKVTKEVLLEIPSKKMIDMISKFMDINGLFIDEIL